METVLLTAYEYSQSKTQGSVKPLNQHMIWYQKWLLKSANYTEYKIMVIAQQPQATWLKNWSCKVRKVYLFVSILRLFEILLNFAQVSDFTEGGKRVIT